MTRANHDHASVDLFTNDDTQQQFWQGYADAVQPAIERECRRLSRIRSDNGLPPEDMMAWVDDRVWRMLRDGVLPPTDAVRAEEMINYFTYDYAPPTSRDVPFSLSADWSSVDLFSSVPLVTVSSPIYLLIKLALAGIPPMPRSTG